MSHESATIMDVPREVRQMRVGMLVIGLQFIVPAISYIVDPAATVATMQAIESALGGRGTTGDGTWLEAGRLWHMLAVGNVMTLGALCLLLRADVTRFLPALPGLFFLKSFSAFYSLAIAVAHDTRAFYAVFVLDFTTACLMVALSLRAAHALARDRSAPWWARWLLLDPEAVERSLERARARGLPAPNLWQMVLGARAMWHRIVFRSHTIGTCAAAVRDTWRARVLSPRVLRAAPLVWERAIMPFDPSGLAAPPARTIRHLLAAHHDDGQAVYDLEVLALYGTGAGAPLAVLRDEVARVVDGSHPRAAWLKDLCVYEGYHAGLLADVDRALARARAGLPVADEAAARSPDLTLAGTLAWCAAQPASPQATRAARRAGTFRARFTSEFT